MVKPLSRILVIEDEPISLREIVKGLNAAARSLDNPLGIAFSGVATAREALAAIESDGDIQAVLVDDKLYSLAEGKKDGGRKKLQMSALELVLLREAEQEAVSHRLECLEPQIHHHAAHPRSGYRMNIRGVLHAVVAAESGHHAAQPLGPVARPERLAVQRHPLNDELDDGVGRGLGHAELY